MSYRSPQAAKLIKDIYDRAYEVEGQNDILRVDLDLALCQRIESFLEQQAQQPVAQAGRETVMVLDPLGIVRDVGKSVVNWLSQWEEDEMTNPDGHVDQKTGQWKGKSRL